MHRPSVSQSTCTECAIANHRPRNQIIQNGSVASCMISPRQGITGQRSYGAFGFRQRRRSDRRQRIPRHLLLLGGARRSFAQPTLRRTDPQREDTHFLDNDTAPGRSSLPWPCWAKPLETRVLKSPPESSTAEDEPQAITLDVSRGAGLPTPRKQARVVHATPFMITFLQIVGAQASSVE